jgi:hypothetical protein
VECAGLTQTSQLDPAVRLEIPIRALELTQILGQYCDFQVDWGGGGTGRPAIR